MTHSKVDPSDRTKLSITYRMWDLKQASSARITLRASTCQKEDLEDSFKILLALLVHQNKAPLYDLTYETEPQETAIAIEPTVREVVVALSDMFRMQDYRTTKQLPKSLESELESVAAQCIHSVIEGWAKEA